VNQETLSSSDIVSLLDLFEGASSTKSYALNDKTIYHNGIHGSVDLCDVQIVHDHTSIKDRPVLSIRELILDESKIRRVLQFEMSCCNVLRFIAEDAIAAAQKLAGSADEIREYLMEGCNLSDKYHNVRVNISNK
jgi:hypothetical protein